MSDVLEADVPHPDAVASLMAARHGDPFSLLGPHAVPGGVAVRAMLPGADAVEALNRQGAPIGHLRRIHPDGLWDGIIPVDMPYRLRIGSQGASYETEDAYAFPSTLGELDLYLLAEGRHHGLYRVLGAHPMQVDGVWGVRFAVWASNAQRVSVVGAFNHWDGRVHPMRAHRGAGVWELFIPRLRSGLAYKYELIGPDGALLPLKADPVAWATERPPGTASVIPEPAWPDWTDAEWMARRAGAQAPDAPVSVYEVHAFSWMPAATETGGWAGLADRLIPYATRMGFTHVELLPVMEHPFGGSWGYQPLGQFAPSARLGSPQDFARFVDRCHRANLGVILDWVPAHFPTDEHGLARFDGTALYEHSNPFEGFHQDWNTLIYNLGRAEVANFMLASALFWLEQYHIDGLRVDAVASMLYRDYSRKQGEWVPNRYGGRENLESIAFLQELSRAVAARAPGAVLIAEESTSWPGVTRPADEGGLGFTYKWNMGWMHDTLHYMQEQPVHRRWHHAEINFGLVYAFSERFVLPLSHDEVVHLKHSLWGKMPCDGSGDDWQRAANLRAYYGFMWTHPGKKLLFMGCEFGQRGEWNHDTGPEWHLLDSPVHAGVQALVRDLNTAYRALPALHRRDCEHEGFRWVVLDDAEHSVFAYLRFGAEGDAPVLVACNFTPVPRHDYRLGVPRTGRWREVVNTDAGSYGGSNLGNGGEVRAEQAESHGQPASLTLLLPPLSTLMLEWVSQ